MVESLCVLAIVLWVPIVLVVSAIRNGGVCSEEHPCRRCRERKGGDA